MYDKGDLSGALKMFKKSLTIREKSLGNDHPDDTADSLVGISIIEEEEIANKQITSRLLNSIILCIRKCAFSVM